MGRLKRSLGFGFLSQEIMVLEGGNKLAFFYRVPFFNQEFFDFAGDLESNIHGCDLDVS